MRTNASARMRTITSIINANQRPRGLHSTTTGAVPVGPIPGYVRHRVLLSSRQASLLPVRSMPLRPSRFTRCRIALSSCLVIFAALLFAACFSQAALAFGITPARSQVDFLPGVDYIGSFRIVNDEGMDGFVRISASGDLAYLVELPDDMVRMDSDGAVARFVVHFPRELLSPGDHSVDIVAEPVSRIDAGGVSAHVGLTHVLTVHVPANGSFPLIDVDVQSDNESVTVVTNVKNIGNTPMRSVQPFMALLHADKQVVNSTSPPRPIDAGASNAFSFGIASSAVPPGRYDVNVRVDYDNKTTSISSAWQRGRPQLTLLRATSIMPAGDLAPFEFTVRGDWNEPISGVYADVAIFDQFKRRARSARTEMADIAPGQEYTFAPVFNMNGIAAGQANVSITLHIGGVVDEYVVPVEMVEPSGLQVVVRNGPTILAAFALLAAGAVVAVLLGRLRRRHG